MPSPVVETRGLQKVFRDFWGRPRVHALKGLDLRVAEGEVFGLLGPNGSGKSTTIKILLGLLHPTAGSVRVLGGSPRDIRLKARIGYLGEESHFYPHLNADETLAFFGKIFALSSKEIARRSDALIRRTGLEDARKRPVGEYSKGMLRRIGLAQALINDPDLLILDEPTAGLDPIGNREVKDLLLELKRRGKTVLISSHLLADVEDVCDRVAILHQGQLKACGSVEKLLEDDQRTQIISPRLSPETIEAVRALISEREGDRHTIEVGAPSTRLEELFLRTVKSPGEAPSSHEPEKAPS